MATHSHVRIWIHMVFGTHQRERMLHRSLRSDLRQHLLSAAREVGLDIEELNREEEKSGNKRR